MKKFKRFCAGLLDVVGWILAVPGLLVILLSTFLFLLAIMVAVSLLGLAVFLGCILLIPSGILDLALKALVG